MIYTSMKQLRLAANLNFKDLTPSDKKIIAKGKIREIACYCKWSYTQASLFQTCLGNIYCNSYTEYCEMLNLRGK